MKRSARITLHPTALQHNLKRAKNCAPTSKINAVIKANAYGHGAIEVAGILYELADGFAVSCMSEAVELRQASIDLPITILQGPQSIEDLRIAEAYQLRLTIHDKQQLALLNQFTTSKNTHFDINLKLDTGMHRLGFHPDKSAQIFKQLTHLSCVNPNNIIIMSHFSSADELDNNVTQQQMDCFNKAYKSIETHVPLAKTLANSAGILGWKDSHMDWVRPGIMLYGSSPFADSHRDTHNLKASMTLNAPIIAIHKLNKGDVIGYAGSYQCPQDMTVAVIAIGYADGYPRHAKTGTPVFINRHKTKLLGRVSMDMIVVNIDNVIQDNRNSIQVGDLAELWGENLSIDYIATHAETISYELLCNAGNLCEIMGN